MISLHKVAWNHVNTLITGTVEGITLQGIYTESSHVVINILGVKNVSS